ncbi:S-adenosyl-L-methionine-dependent methyltransferase, partial [Pilobolus umbonatus]
WDTVYERENINFKEIGDMGEIWFGEDSVEKMVEWTLDTIQDTNASILDLGCGNGHLLLELSNEGYRQLTGIDYSPSAIQLAQSIAKQRECEWIKYQTVDFLNDQQWYSHPFKVVMDKGTYDAISLHPDQVAAKKSGEEGPRERYVSAVRELIDSEGLFLITSCNWTKEELIENFKPCKFFYCVCVCVCDFKYHSSVKYPIFQFGGHSGSKICTVAFEPI